MQEEEKSAGLLFRGMSRWRPCGVWCGRAEGLKATCSPRRMCVVRMLVHAAGTRLGTVLARPPGMLSDALISKSGPQVAWSFGGFAAAPRHRTYECSRRALRGARDHYTYNGHPDPRLRPGEPQTARQAKGHGLHGALSTPKSGKKTKSGKKKGLAHSKTHCCHAEPGVQHPPRGSYYRRPPQKPQEGGIIFGGGGGQCCNSLKPARGSCRSAR